MRAACKTRTLVCLFVCVKPCGMEKRERKDSLFHVWGLIEMATSSLSSIRGDRAQRGDQRKEGREKNDEC